MFKLVSYLNVLSSFFCIWHGFIFSKFIFETIGRIHSLSALTLNIHQQPWFVWKIKLGDFLGFGFKLLVN